ncbi:MAG: hypothetical protein ABIR78_03820 [Ferruginibacter sp.]
MKRLLYSALIFATVLSYFSCQKMASEIAKPVTPVQQTQQYVIVPQTDDQRPKEVLLMGVFLGSNSYYCNCTPE